MRSENYPVRGESMIGGQTAAGALAPLPLGTLLQGSGQQQQQRGPAKSAPCSPQKKPNSKQHMPNVPAANLARADSFHVIHKVPVGDSPYVRAKHVQLVDKDPDRAIALFWSAINAGDRVDSALKDMAIVMKQQNRPEEAIEAIKSLRVRCSEQAQESLDNVLLDLYKRCGRLDDQINLLKHKLDMIHQGSAFNGKRTKTARSQGKKFQVSIEQEATRLLGNLGWAYMQQSNYIAAEVVYRKALAIEPDNNKVCNLGICLMKQGRLEEAKAMLQSVTPTGDSRWGSESHLKSYERAQEMLKELETSLQMQHQAAAEITRSLPPSPSKLHKPAATEALSEQTLARLGIPDLWESLRWRPQPPSSRHANRIGSESGGGVDSELSEGGSEDGTGTSCQQHSFPSSHSDFQKPGVLPQQAPGHFKLPSQPRTTYGSASGFATPSGDSSGPLALSTAVGAAVAAASGVQSVGHSLVPSSGTVQSPPLTLSQLSQQYNAAAAYPLPYNSAKAQYALSNFGSRDEGAGRLFNYWDDDFATPPAEDCISSPDEDLIYGVGPRQGGGIRQHLGQRAVEVSQTRDDVAWHAQTLRMRLEAIQQQSQSQSQSQLQLQQTQSQQSHWAHSQALGGRSAPAPAFRQRLLDRSLSYPEPAPGTKPDGLSGAGLRADAEPFVLGRSQTVKENLGHGYHGLVTLSNDRMPLTYDRTNEFVPRPPSRIPSPNTVMGGERTRLSGYDWNQPSKLGASGTLGRSGSYNSRSSLVSSEMRSVGSGGPAWAEYRGSYYQQNENQPRRWATGPLQPWTVGQENAVVAMQESLPAPEDKACGFPLQGPETGLPPLPGGAAGSQKRNRVPTPVKEKKDMGQWSSLGFTVSPERLDFTSVDRVVDCVIGAESVHSSPGPRQRAPTPAPTPETASQTMTGGGPLRDFQTNGVAATSADLEVKRQRRLRIFQEMTTTGAAA